MAALVITRVVMEATSDYWKPPFYVLEAAGFETWLVNAKDVKHLPGRPKTDRLDAVWLCKVAGREMLAALIGGQRDPEGAGPVRAGTDARQDHRSGGGVHRPVRRPPRVPA